MRKPKAKKKVHVEDEETPPQYEVGGPSSPDLRLPPRLFATDRFPTRRLNIYSSPDLLPFIRNVLRDTPEFETIRRSCFGKLFDLPARQCPVSCKLIHAFLTRQLVCLPKNTLWSAFGGSPFRYGLEEFGTVTGLPCGSYPERYNPNTGKAIVAGKDRVWKRLFGKKKFVTIADLCRMLETDKDMDGWKKIRIALIIIVDGVLIAHKQEARPTPRYVRMVENLKTFLAFPWGRESFLKTISCMKPPKFVPKKCEDPVATLVKTLKQRSYRLQGFPLSLQLVAFRAIPLLLDYIPAPSNNLTVMDLEDGTLPQHKSINAIHIRRVEFDPNLVVTPIIPIESQPQPGWGLNDLMQGHHLSTNFYLVASSPKHHPTLQNQDDAPMETDDLPQTTSPIISQYEAQLHRDSADDHLASSPVTDNGIHTESSVHVSPNHTNACVHTSPDHNDYSRQVSPVFNQTPQPSQVITHPNDDTDDYDEPPRTPVSKQPPWNELNSVVYDKSDHPNSPEINHILYHGVRIYDPINPDPPIFDSSIPRSFLLLSPQPKTILTSPTKSNDTLPGFAVHATTVNAFTATASSESPPSLPSKVTESPPSLPFKDQNALGVVDLTATKDVESHVPSLEENHLANELFKSPLIPAVTLISPLPGLEWDLFYNTVSTKTDVYHSTPSSFDFSNKFLLDLAKPKQWTSTRHMEVLIHMLGARHSTHLLTEKSAFTTPLLPAYITDSWPDFAPCRKRSTFLWDERIVDIVLHQGMKWMEDVHTIYTPMLWDRKHWVGLAINLDMGYIEILDPMPALYADTRVERFMLPLVTILPYLVRKVAMCELTQFRGVKKFVWRRLPDLYNNSRSGDCGPVSMKFLEMHALGDPAPHMSGITDEAVDDFRKQYALDIYKTIVMPAYST
ncbi:BnaA10g10570D [Brassica napus]|uniref:BnaA10g10570D protein n=1 Tax=Brassica napus TaxID=3708 RepID=A0A078H5R3_BRANA|nr:BnaA10g10570D [Brassica napus]